MNRIVTKWEYAAWSMAFVDAERDDHGPLQGQMLRLSDMQPTLDHATHASIRSLLQTQAKQDLQPLCIST